MRRPWPPHSPAPPLPMLAATLEKLAGEDAVNEGGRVARLGVDAPTLRVPSPCDLRRRSSEGGHERVDVHVAQLPGPLGSVNVRVVERTVFGGRRPRR